MTGRIRRTAMRALVPAALVASLCAARAARADELKVGDRLAELDGATDVAGKPFHLKSHKGWRVIAFGASWCGPCAKELPAWDKLAPQFKGKVAFIAVDLDEKRENGRHFHQKLGLAHMLLAYMSPDSPSAAKYGSDHMPTTVVADPNGVVRYIISGFEKGDVSGEVGKLKGELNKLVK